MDYEIADFGVTVSAPAFPGDIPEIMVPYYDEASRLGIDALSEYLDQFMGQPVFTGQGCYPIEWVMFTGGLLEYMRHRLAYLESIESGGLG